MAAFTPAPIQTDATQPLRSDLLAIADLVAPATRVLDLGCGDGALLEYLVRQKQVMGAASNFPNKGCWPAYAAG